MPSFLAFLLMAQGGPDVRIQVPLKNVRPSKIARVLTTMGDLKVIVVPDDPASTLTLVGSQVDVDEIKDRIGLFDNAPRRSRFAIRIESPLDHAEWKGQVDLVNNANWTGEDGATGVKLRLSTRINDDGTCTVMAEARSADAAPVSVVFRIKHLEEQHFAMKARGILPEGAKTPWVPKFSIKYLGDAEEAPR